MTLKAYKMKVHFYFHFGEVRPVVHPVKHKIGEKYSEAQQYTLQLYNFHRMLVFLRHVSTHFPSHPQVLYNLRLITVKYLRKCVRDLIDSLTMTNQTTTITLQLKT
jgi:hypothetical protein